MSTETKQLKADEAFKLDGSHVIVHESLIMFPFLEPGSRRLKCGTVENADWTQKMLMSAYNAGGVLNPSAEVSEGAASPTTKKSKKQPSRADRAADIINQLDQSYNETEELREELQNWLDNMPENLQQGQKAQELEEAIGELESASSSIDEAKSSLEGTNFPGMF